MELVLKWMRQGKKIPDFWARDPFREDCIIPRTKLEIKYTVGSKLFPARGKAEIWGKGKQ